MSIVSDVYEESKKFFVWGAIFVVVFFSFASVAESNTWSIKKFKVVEKVFSEELEIFGLTVPDPDNVVNVQNYLTDDQEQEVEAWFEKIAKEFELLGFREPRYEAKTSDGKFYEVHVFPFDGTARARNDCDDPSKVTVIQINPLSEEIFKNGKLTEKGYQDLAHELFHTVQYAYPMFQKNCGQGAWILEGTAEAVGIETARKILNIKPYTFCQIGLRPYSEELYVYKKGGVNDKPCMQSRAYQSQSFWQFLGEYNSAAGRPNPKQFVPPNYSYLHEFFNTQHKSSHWKDEYEWLDTALRKKFVFGLSRAYPSFIGTFSAYWKKRLPGYPGNFPSVAEERKKKWHEYVFGGCDEVPLKKTIIHHFPIAEIEPVAARCLDLEFTFTGQANFTILAEGTGHNLLSLAMTSADGGKRIQPKVSPNAQQPQKVSFKFSIPVKTGDHKVFVISNIANKPQYSQRQKPTIKVIFNTASSNLLTPKTASPPKPKKPKRKKPKGAQFDQHDSGVQLAQAQIDQGWKTQSWRVSARRVNRGGCQNAFRDKACGPHTQINLSLKADTASILDEAITPGMSLERMFNVMGAIGERGPENIPIDGQKALRDIRSKDGSTIRIAIPLIDYGFKGSFSNASIAILKATDGQGRPTGWYRAIGPGRVGGCASGYFPLSGKVTIEEASRDVLRGTYSAQLVDRNDITGCISSLPVRKNISGTFSLAEPRLDNTRTSIQLSEDPGDHVLQDVNEMLPGITNGPMGKYIRNKMKQNEREREERKANKQSSKTHGAGGAVCECQCETADIMIHTNPDCYKQCEPIFNMCKGNQGSRQAALTSEKKAKEGEEIKAMRQQYEAFADSVAPNEAVKEQMMDAFDQMKTEQKKLLMMSIPRK